MFLHNREEDEYRDQSDDRNLHKYRPLDVKFALRLVDLQDKRRKGRVQKRHRRQKVVPGPHRLEDDARNRNRLELRQDDRPEDAPDAATIDDRGLRQIPHCPVASSHGKTACSP